MIISDTPCITCIVSKQEKMIRPMADTEKKHEFMRVILQLFQEHLGKDSSIMIQRQVDDAYERIFGAMPDYSALKSLYNQKLLSMEDRIEQLILSDPDPVHAALRYVMAGNYIDFIAQDTVDDTVLEKLLADANAQSIDAALLERFKAELAQCSTLLYVLDNCGEIVLDKILIRLLKNLYPGLKITAMVRGAVNVNDATYEDAVETGLDKLAEIVDNGSRMVGCMTGDMSEEAVKLLRESDMVITKGQANFESLHGEGFSPWYVFLCKCDRMIDVLGIPRLTPVFRKEEDFPV